MRLKLSIMFTCFCISLFSQELKVSADKNPAIIGEQILIQYSINAKGSQFQSPNFNGLKILSGPNTSTQSSYTFINGKSEKTITTSYSFYVQATKEGNYTITSASIKSNSKLIKSKSYNLKVVKGNQKNQAEINNNLFISVETSKRNIVVGEQILIKYKLHTRVDLQNTEVTALPNLNGFWSKDLESSSRFKREVINGVPYNVATVKKSVLTAQKSGKLIIDPMELKCSVRISNKRNNRDPFASFFGNMYNIKDEFISSKPIIITVSELPKSPANFKGIVGDMEVKSDINTTEIHANDALTYKIQIIGTGNLELIKSPEINFPEDFEMYDPKISEKIFEGGRKRSIKTFEYLLIPRFKGEYIIPEVSITVYETKNKRYKTKKTNQHRILVLESKNEEQADNIQNTVRSEKVDINYILTETLLKKKESNYIEKRLFIILFFFPILILILLLIYQKIILKQKYDPNTWRNKKANSIALKRLKTAQSCIKNNDFDSFFEEIEKSLWGYFSDKFKVSVSNLSKKSINTYFSKFNIKEETRASFISLLDECEFARYAPSKNKNFQMEQLLNKAKKVIVEVENQSQ